MSKETWIIIAQISIPSIITLLIGVWQIRVMRAIANPAQPAPKIARNVIGKIRYFMDKYGYKFICIGVPVFFIARELVSPSPLSKLSVGIIVFNAFVLNFYLTAWYTIYIARTLINLMDSSSSAKSEA